MKKNNRFYIMKLNLRLFTILAVLGLIASCTGAPRETPPELTMLVERAAIEDLVSNYYKQFRSDTEQDFMSFFTTDGRLEVNGWVVNGYDEIKDMYLQAGIIDDKKEAPKKAEGAVPEGTGETLYTNLDIDLQGDKAIVKMIWLTIGSELLTSPPKVTEYGTEWAEVVKQDGRWLFKNRIIHSEGGMPEGQLENLK
ncbi:MAG: nuclear transport factor 2 family protein [Desulfobacteraceae bacterium]|jgi:hypothetical protein